MAVTSVPQLDQDRERDMGGLARLAGLETVSEQLAGPIAILRAEQARRRPARRSRGRRGRT